MVGSFQRAGDAIAETEKRVAKTADTYQKYKTKLDEAGKATDAQQAQLIKLSGAHLRAQQALSKQRDLHNEITKALIDSGIATNNLAVSEDAIRQSAVQLGVTLNKVRETIRTYSDDVRKARDAERELAASDGLKKKAQDAQALIAAKTAGEQWKLFLKQAQEAEERLAKENGLRQKANEAQEAARQFNTLARASQNLVPKVVSLRDAVNAIINPTNAARSTLDGLEKEVGELAGSIDAIKGPVKGYADTLRQIEAVQRSLAQQSGLVDSFRQQVVAVQAARAQFVAARNDVNGYAAAVRGGAENLTGKLKESQDQARRAALALRDALNAAKAMREEMWKAGIATSDLAVAENRLATAARTTTQAVTTLKGAVEQHGEAVERTRKRMGLFSDEGRTTLSMVQRMRGEILALAPGLEQ